MIISEDKSVEFSVQLLDYGTMGIVKLDEIFPLRRQYLELPMQACQAYVYGK